MECLSCKNENGIVVVEFHYSKIIMDELSDIMTQFIMNIYFTFQLKTISTLFKKYDLVPFDVFL